MNHVYMNYVHTPNDINDETYIYELNMFSLATYLLSNDGSEIHLHFVVHNQDKGSTSTSEDVGKGTLEESIAAFLGVDLSHTVKSTVVKDFLLARLHHQSSSDGIKGIREETGEGGDNLGNKELVQDGGLGVGQEGSLGGIVTTEVASSVGDDTEDGDTETLVKSLNTINGSDLVDTINQTGELSVSTSLTNISGKSSSGEIEGVDEHQRSGTSSTTGGEVTKEELPEFGLGVVGTEDLLIGVLEGEVKGLSREISDDVSEVSSPESGDTFFFGDSDQDIHNALVGLVTGKLLVSSLGLEKELNSFNGGNGSLGDSSGDTTESKIEGKIASLDFRTFTHVC